MKEKKLMEKLETLIKREKRETKIVSARIDLKLYRKIKESSYSFNQLIEIGFETLKTLGRIK